MTYTGSESTALIDRAPVVTPRSRIAPSSRGVPASRTQSDRDGLASSRRRGPVSSAGPLRTAIEHQPSATWAGKALSETDPAKRDFEALMALARCAGVCPQHRKADTPPVDTAMRGRLDACLNLDIAALPHESQPRCAPLEIVLNRFDRPDEATIGKLISTRSSTRSFPRNPSSRIGCYS